MTVLHLALRTSLWMSATLALAHAGACGLLWPLTLAAEIKWAIAAALSASFAWTLRRTALLRGAGAIIGLELGEEGRVSFQTRAGGWQEARLLPTTYVTPLLTVLNLRLAGRRTVRHVVLMPDSLDAETYRQLRVRLRWAQAAALSSSNF